MHDIVTIVAKYFVVIPVAVWLVVLLRQKRPQQLRFVVFSALSLILTFILVKIAASLHQDPRPFVRDHVVPYFSHAADNGFPSDHTAYSAMIALIILRYSRWLGATLLVVSIIIGSSRVMAGIHHGQDILAGLLVAVIGVGLVWLGERAVRRSKAASRKNVQE